MVRAAATLSTDGTVPTPLLIRAVNYPETGWAVYSPTNQTHQVFSPAIQEIVVGSLADKDLPIWQSVARTPNGPDEEITWYLGGTLPSWIGTPLSLVILLEEDDPEKALEMGQSLMGAVLGVD